MKKFLLLWLTVCLAVLLIPKAVDRFTPKTIYKVVPIYRVKEVEKIKEVPVYKGERIVEKEKVIYTDKRMDLFIIHQIDEDTFTMNMTDEGMEIVWEISIADQVHQKGLLLHRKRRNPYQSASVSMSTVGFNTWR